MKKKSLLFALLFLLASCVFAQAPKKISFQAVIRDSENNLVANSNVGIRISVLQYLPTGSPVFIESQSASTNENGLVSIEIGSGIPDFGAFQNIDWSQGPYFIKTETDPHGGNNYSISGTQQLLSVPFALYAENSGSTIAGPMGPPGPLGPAGVDGTNGIDGQNGAPGPQGVAGPQGPIGLTGATGSDGPTGLTGSQGIAGPQGPIGLTGATGADGPNGPQGVAGAQGPIGLTGATGADGPNGLTGSQGIAGPQGPIGLTGATGADGPTGLTGSQGIAGPQGPIGLTGATGADGPNGPQGVAGAQGPIGLTGATGADGPNGPQGVAGPQGSVGSQGPIGVAGPQGIAGPQGPIGLTGATGANGPNGPQGITGPQGPIGLTGATGATGPTGATGAQGIAGAQGPIGLTGATGADGPNGPQGITGPQGPIGLVGATGPQGNPGLDGLTSLNGLTGPITLFGTNNQVNVSVNPGAGAVIFSTPQNIHTGATPTFLGLTLSSFASNGGPLYTNTSGVLTQTAAGTVTQVLHGGTNPSFSAITLTTDVTGVLPSANGGTGVNNGSSTITLGGNLITSGANPLTFTTTGATNVTLPTSGTLINSSETTLSSLSTVGTITTGTWNATKIGLAYGGTNTDLSGGAAVGDMLFANAASSFARLADVATGNCLISGGIGVAPSWGKISLSTHITGILDVANGGTGLSTPPSNGNLLIGDGTDFMLAGLTGTANQVTVTNGAGTITLSTPQNIHTAATPTFSGLTLSSFAMNGGPLYTNASGILAQATAGTAIQVLHGGVNPSFSALSLTTDATGILPSTNGGTGVNNGGSTITLGGNLATSGANALTFTTTGATNVTLPTSGTLVNSAVTTLSSLASVGTITTGTWNANTIGVGYGGTGVGTTPANGNLLIGNGTNYAVAGITGTANQVIVTNGSGTITLSTPQNIHTAAIPTFAGLTLSSYSSNGGPLYTNASGFISQAAAGTGVQVLHGGTTPSFSALTLTTDVAGVLPSANGGTGVNNGASTITLGGSLTTSGANALTLTTTGATSVTLPTSGTLVNSAVTTLSSLASIGTVTTGAWNATKIGLAYGGTNTDLSSGGATGDMLFANSANTFARIADVATGNSLISGGVGISPSWGKIGLATHVSGTLPVANGGTGQTSFIDGELMIGNSVGNTITKATLTAGTGITITNGNGSVTITNNLANNITMVNGTSTLTTTSITDVALPTPMSVTPGAGDYLVTFTGNVSNSNTDKAVIMSIYSNGTQLPYTEMTYQGQGNDKNQIAMNAYVTGLGAGQAIDIRWRVQANTGTVTNRCMIVQKVN